MASRFRLGKQAAEDAITVTELTESGKDFIAHEIAHHPPKENVPISDTVYQIFESRQDAYGKLWESLVNEDGYPILGIYGMPGAGKTRMAEEAWKQAKEKGIFSKVTRANVGGEKVDVIKLQDQIAGYLDCHLESKDNEIHRASQLARSLINGGKTLVIFDDVWVVILLNKIGVPFGDGRSKGCKILFTSRRQDICLRNNCHDPIEIKTLTEVEAWHMFEKAVGSSKIESLQESLLAENVCKRCGRLPLLINAVGNALKYMTESSWKDALYQLENSRFEEIDGIQQGVYSCLKLSFEKLTEAGKTCLLLCSLFPEDADINIERLSNLATGSQLLDRQRNIDGVVDILKLSSLLLEGKFDHTVKLHDVIRDVARNIAAKDPKYAFLSTRCELGWLDNTDYHTTKLLHLDLTGKNVCFPNDLVCPNLHTLWLQCKFMSDQKLSSDFSEGLTDLKFMLQGMSFPEQQLSIHRLQNLRMIILDNCNIDATFFSSVSENLETLCIQSYHLPSPLDLSKLKNLRKLELHDYRKIRMAPKSISSLSRLEELIIPDGFTVWGDADADATSVYVELNKLTLLRNITISLPFSHSYLNEDITSKLQEFKISLGLHFSHSHHIMSNKSVIFNVNHIQSRWMALIERAERVSIKGVEGLFNNSKQIEAFANLKRLEIDNCYDLGHLVSLPVDGRNLPLTYFNNLTFLTIDYCQGLKYLFSASVATCLQKIQTLRVRNCDAIEEIIRVDYHGEVVSFPRLKDLTLSVLPSLNSFSTHSKVAFPSLEELTIRYINSASDIWGKGIYHQEDSTSFSQLRVLYVKKCKKLENVIPVTLDHDFKNLQKVVTKYCESLKTVFSRYSIATDSGNLNKNDGGPIVFPGLRELYLNELPNIKSFCSYDCDTVDVNSNKPKVSFPNIEGFIVFDCKTSGLTEEIELGRDDNSPAQLIRLQLGSPEEQLFPSKWQHQLQNLQLLYLSGCIWHGHSLFKATLKRLKDLTISNCEIGPSLFTSSFFRCFQQLEALTVRDCRLLEEIVEEDIGMDDEKTISLPCLNSLVLIDLLNLKSFSQTSNYAFHMPALESVYLRGCHRMNKFTSLPTDMPSLQIRDEMYVSVTVSDLNSYIRQKVYKKDEHSE